MKFIKRRLAIFFVALLAMPTMSVSAGQAATAQPTMQEFADVPAEQQKEENNLEKEEKIKDEVQQTDIATDSTAALKGSGEDIAETEAASEIMDTVDEIKLIQKNETEMAARAVNRAGGTFGGITWAIDADGKLTVDGTGDFSSGKSVDCAPWYSERETITSAVVNVTGITSTAYMFYECSNMNTLDISGLDTSHVTDMSYMFSYCSNLQTIDVSSMNTAQVTDMSYMFFRCHGLTSLDVTSFNTGNVTDMSFMFQDCISLTSLNLTGLNTGKVKNMTYMFTNCCSLSALDVSGFDTSQVTNMGCMFWECREVEELDVSGFNTSNVTNMEYLFGACNKIKVLNVSSFNTNEVIYMNNMFGGCIALDNLDLSNFNTSKVVSMMSMFYNCNAIKTLDLHTFDTSNVTNMAYMFVNCYNLTDVNFTGWNTGQLANVDEMFYRCSSITELDLSNFNFASISSVKDMFIGCSDLNTIKAPTNVKTSVQLYGSSESSHMFWYNPNGDVVNELPQNLTSSVIIYKSMQQDITRAVKYVLYEESVKRNISTTGTVKYILKDGALPSGIELKEDGIVAGIPMEKGSFTFAVSVNVDGNPEGKVMWYKLNVLDNADVNVEDITDSGYELIEYVPDFRLGTLGGDGTQTMVSKGDYGEFKDLYLDGIKLTKGTDYTGESGSTRLTIRNQTLSQAGRGRHTLAMEFRTIGNNSLRRAAQNYTITDDSNSGNNGGSGNSGGGGRNPGRVGNSQPGKPVISYTVVEGDCLWSIAEKFYGSGKYWTKIYADNTTVIRNPNQIYVGQVLQIYSIEADPTTIIQGDTYTVRRGDTLWKISEKKYGKGQKWRKIYRANTARISDPKRIYVGQVLVIPTLVLVE